MPFRKIDIDPKYDYKKLCKSPQHTPPRHIVLEPGMYEWVCPVCGEIQIVNIPEHTMSAEALKLRLGLHGIS